MIKLSANAKKMYEGFKAGVKSVKGKAGKKLNELPGKIERGTDRAADWAYNKGPTAVGGVAVGAGGMAVKEHLKNKKQAEAFGMGFATHLRLQGATDEQITKLASSEAVSRYLKQAGLAEDYLQSRGAGELIAKPTEGVFPAIGAKMRNMGRAANLKFNPFINNEKYVRETALADQETQTPEVASAVETSAQRAAHKQRQAEMIAGQGKRTAELAKPPAAAAAGGMNIAPRNYGGVPGSTGTMAAPQTSAAANQPGFSHAPAGTKPIGQ